MTSFTMLLNFWCETLHSGFNCGKSYIHLKDISGIWQIGLGKYLKVISTLVEMKGFGKQGRFCQDAPENSRKASR